MIHIFFSIWSKNSAGYQRRGRRGNEVGSFQLKFEVNKKKKKKPKRIKKKKKVTGVGGRRYDFSYLSVTIHDWRSSLEQVLKAAHIYMHTCVHSNYEGFSTVNWKSG